MELNEIFRTLDKNLKDINNELGFSRSASDEKSITFSGEKGIYRLVHDAETNIIQFDCAYEDKGEETQWNTVSRSLFELSVADDRDVKSSQQRNRGRASALVQCKKKGGFGQNQNAEGCVEN